MDKEAEEDESVGGDVIGKAPENGFLIWKRLLNFQRTMKKNNYLWILWETTVVAREQDVRHLVNHDEDELGDL